ncbi:hypothetical protein GOODEAATRI_006097, partial [Goodea atripinnis]
PAKTSGNSKTMTLVETPLLVESSLHQDCVEKAGNARTLVFDANFAQNHKNHRGVSGMNIPDLSNRVKGGLASALIRLPTLKAVDQAPAPQGRWQRTCPLEADAIRYPHFC